MLTPTGIHSAKPQTKPTSCLMEVVCISSLKRGEASCGGSVISSTAKKRCSLWGRSPRSLATARTKRNEARKLLAEGKDPSKERKDNRIKSATAAQNTFGVIANELIDKLELERKSPATLAKQKWLLEDLASGLTDRPIMEITAAEILVVLRKAEQRGRRETARRCHAA